MPFLTQEGHMRHPPTNHQVLKKGKRANVTGCNNMSAWLNTLRPRQNGHYFPDDISECIFLKENDWIPINISLKFVPKSPINNIPALVQIMAWRRPGDKPLSEPMLVRLPTHMCVTRPQWVKRIISRGDVRFEHKPAKCCCPKVRVRPKGLGDWIRLRSVYIVD